MNVFTASSLIFLLIVTASAAGANQDEELEALFTAYENYESLHAAGDLEGSLPEAETAYGLGKKLFGIQSEDTATLAFNYAFNLTQLGRYAEAQPIWLETLDSFEQIYGASSPEIVPVLMALGEAGGAVADVRSMKKYYDRALRLSERAFGEDSANYGWNLTRAGTDLWSQTADDDALELLDRGHAILSRALGIRDEKTVFSAYRLGTAHLERRAFEPSLAFFLEVYDTFPNPDHPEGTLELNTHRALAKIYEVLGRRKEATPHLLALGRVTVFEGTETYAPFHGSPAEYPRLAKNQGLEGQVTIAFDVDSEGFIHNPTVVDLRGHRDFEDAVLLVADSLRFIPRFDGDAPANVKNVRHTFEFELNPAPCGSGGKTDTHWHCIQ